MGALVSFKQLPASLPSMQGKFYEHMKTISLAIHIVGHTQIEYLCRKKNTHSFKMLKKSTKFCRGTFPLALLNCISKSECFESLSWHSVYKIYKHENKIEINDGLYKKRKKGNTFNIRSR